MSAYMQKTGTKLFRKHMEQYAPPDPVYEYHTDAKGKHRRKKRDVPPGISARDAKILKAVQRRARSLDKSFNFCGLHFGWTFIIGIVPGAGDVACAALNYGLVLRKAREADLPSWLVGRMLLNNIISACGGIVPVVGDVIIAMYKANSRNAMLLEEFLRIRGEENLKLQAREDETTSTSQVIVSSISQRGAEKISSGAGAKDTWRSFGSFIPHGGRRHIPEFNGDRGRFIEDMNS